MDNKDIFKRERWELFIHNNENPDDLIEAIKEKFQVKEFKNTQGEETRTFILERVGEDKK